MENSSPKELLGQLQKLLASGEQKDVRKQACDIARKLALELEEPGDLVTRIVFGVRYCSNETQRVAWSELYSIASRRCLTHPWY